MTLSYKVLLRIVANRLGDFWEESRIVPEEQCGFRPERSTTDMIFVVRRVQELGRTINISLEIASSIWQKRTTLSIVCYYGKYLPVLEFCLG